MLIDSQDDCIGSDVPTRGGSDAITDYANIQGGIRKRGR